MKTLNQYFLAFGLLVMGGAIAVAFVDQQSAAEFFSSSVNWLVIIAAAFLVIAFVSIFAALDAMKMMIAKRDGRLPVAEDGTAADATAAEEEEEQSWLNNLLAKLQDSKPIEEEEEIDLDHEYDGIRELDNNLPPWWLYGFYATIIFAVIYLVRYHVTESAPTQQEEYEMEMAAAAEAKDEYLKNAANLVDESNVTVVDAEPRIANGAAIFNKSCAVCHAKDGGGGVGPNLTDPYWIHGGSVEKVFETIKYGVPSKGMVSWKDQLSPADMQDVSSYVLTLQGTTPANPKEPQGDLYEAEKAEENMEESDTTETASTEENTETAEL